MRLQPRALSGRSRLACAGRGTSRPCADDVHPGHRGGVTRLGIAPISLAGDSAPHATGRGARFTNAERRGAKAPRPPVVRVATSDDQRAPWLPLPPFWASGACVPVCGLLVALGCCEPPEVPPPMPVVLLPPLV